MAGYALTDAAKAELRTLTHEDGSLDTEEVFTAAQLPSSALHGYYNWDSTHAAHQHWLKVTRELIQSFKIEFVDANNVSRHIPGYVSIVSREEEKATSTSKRIYFSTPVAMSNEVMRKQLLDGLRRELRVLRGKYGHLKEYAELVKESAI